MEAKFKITDQKDLVKKVLIEYPETRDCDKKLVSRIWLAECVFKSLNYANALQLLFDGELTSFSSLVRCRRLLQAEQVELRGAKYKKRIEKLEADVREDIINNNKNERA